MMINRETMHENGGMSDFTKDELVYAVCADTDYRQMCLALHTTIAPKKPD
jgi:hypothetical protein